MKNNVEELKRLLFLSEYKNSTENKELIKENIDSLLESKQTEQQAMSLLTKGGAQNPESLINQFKQFDKSKNQVLLPTIAGAYLEHNNINDLRALFKTVSDFVNSNKIPPPQKTDQGYVIKDKTFKNYLKFAEYIHGLEGMSSGLSKWKGEIQTDVDEPPIWEGNGVKIYDGNDVGKCIKYTQGGATGKRYGFCIGQPANTMWQSYRDQKGSTFHYVVDSNRDLNDPLHIVVVDATKYGIELTDANNITGNVAEFGRDANAYLEYLKKKGAPVDKIFVNKPKTPEEEAETAKLGSRNTDLNWFKDLSFEEKSKYIGRGHLLSDEQFDYLWQFKNDKGGFHLLKQYVSTGQALPEEQFKTLVDTGEANVAKAAE
jgi:hypothetical protein